MMKSKLFLLGCLATVMTGCGPQLADQRDLTLEIGEVVSIPIDAIGQEQLLKVTASSPDAPIHVHVFLKENQDAVERKIALGKPPENLLANEEKANEISLEAVVPANKEVIVRLQSASRQAATVHLEIAN